MNKNRHELPIYKSQAQRNNVVEPSMKLYGSGATMNSPQKNISKINDIQPCYTRREIQTERAINNLSTLSKQSPSFRRNNQLLRSKSGENVKWQSPTKQTMCGQSFRSIIEEINQQNDRTFNQLDEDLKRIKSNLNRIEKESVEAKQSSNCQALSEEVQILQEENQRLREKNTSLINQKRKMAIEIEQYQALIQREKAKQSSFISQKYSQSDSKNEDLINNNRKLKQQLELKDAECERLKYQNSQLSNAKIIFQKRESLLCQEKSKLLLKISGLQKEKDQLKLNFEQQMKIQLQKKDAYYVKIIKNQESKHQQTVTKLKENITKSLKVKQEQITAQSKAQYERLTSEIAKLKGYSSQIKQQRQKINQQTQLNRREIECLKNQIEILGFAHKQTVEQLIEKDEMINQLKKENRVKSLEANNYEEQIQRTKQKLQEQNKKINYLQQLYTKLQSQFQQYQYQANKKHKVLTDSFNNSEKQKNRLQMINQTIKKQNSQLQENVNEVSRQNQRYANQLKRKAEQNLLLKKQNIVLLSSAKNQKLQGSFSPQKPQATSNESQIAQQRLHRLHSARQSRDQHDQIILKEKEMARMKRVQRELNDLMIQCKAENEKTKTLYKEKQVRLQESNSIQKQKIQSLTLKIQQLEKQLYLKNSDYQLRQESQKQIIRKKETEFLLLQRKQAEIKLKNSLLESQNIELKDKIDKILKAKSDKGAELQKKLEDYRCDYKRLLDIILKEITSLSENDRTDMVNVREKDFIIGSTELKSYEQLHKIAEINYSIHSLKETLRSLNRKIKQSTQAIRASQNHQNYSLEKSSMILEESQRPSIRRQEKTSKYSEEKEEQYQKLLAKFNELEKKHQKSINEEKRKSKELDELNQQCLNQKREINRLKNEVQNLSDEKQDLKIKLKYAQQRLLKKDLQNIEQDSRITQFMTPTKQMGFYRQSSMETDKQIYENRLRSRIRSFRSCQKRDNEFYQAKNYDKKMSQYQSNIAKLNKLLETMSEQAKLQEDEIKENKERQRKIQSKYQKKLSQCQHLEEMLEAQKKEKVKLESKLQEQDFQLKLISTQIDKVRNQAQQNANFFDQSKILLEKQFNKALLQKEMIQKKLKKEMSERQQKHASTIQQYQLKTIDMNSQFSKLKELVSQLTIKNDSFILKIDHISAQLTKKQEKLIQNEQKITELRQRLQKQSKQKENMLNVFSTNTNRLTKILEEKEIQIQQLKFIQQSTIINLQHARNQQNRRKQNDSTFSFKHEF